MDMSVFAVDACIEAIHYTLQPARCRSYIEPNMARLAKGLPEQMKQAIEPMRRMDRVMELPPLDAARAEDVLAALETLWTDEGFTLSKDRFQADLAIANDALILASIRMTPSPIAVWGHSMRQFDSKVANPYLDYCRQQLVPGVADLAPNVIGGAYFTEVCKVINVEDGMRVPFGKDKLQMWPHSFVHALLTGVSTDASTEAPLPIGVCGEGDKPLVAICERLRTGADVRDIPGVVHFDPDAQELICNEQEPPLAGKEMAKMDLSGLGIGKKYLTPIAVAPLLSARGCYWNKCTFCGRNRSIDSKFRQMPVDHVGETMESYIRDFGVDLIVFCDEAIAPAMLKGLTQRLEEKDLSVIFGGLFRFEKALLPTIAPAAKHGLNYMIFGLESGCSRVLERMNKGATPEATEAILAECRRAEVRSHVYVIFGFPGETSDQADETMAFLEDSADNIWSIGVNQFYLDPGSYIWTHTDEFGIKVKPGRKLATDPTSYTLEHGIDHSQSFEYVKRLKGHPKLGPRFPVNGGEDYWGIIGALERGWGE